MSDYVVPKRVKSSSSNSWKLSPGVCQHCKQNALLKLKVAKREGGWIKAGKAIIWWLISRAYFKIIFLAAIWDVFNAFKKNRLGTTQVWDAETQAGGWASIERWLAFSAAVPVRCPGLGHRRTSSAGWGGWGWGSAGMPGWPELGVVLHISISLCTSGTWRGHCQLCETACMHKGRDGDCLPSWCAGSCLPALGQLVLTGAARNCMWILNIQTSYYERRRLSILFFPPPPPRLFVLLCYGGGGGERVSLIWW